MLTLSLLVSFFATGLNEAYHGYWERELEDSFQVKVQEPETEQFNSLRAIILDRDSYENKDLRAELSLRMPRVRIVSSNRSEAALPEPYAWIRIRKKNRSLPAIKLGIVMSDGRTYHREIENTDEELNRTLASNITSLLISVERKMAIPTVGEKREQLLEEFASEELSISQTASPIEAIHLEQTRESDSAKRRQSLRAPRSKTPLSAECCGVSVHGLTTLGLARPNYGGAFQGGGAGLRMHYLWGQGGQVIAGLRGVFRKVDSLLISRIQFSIRGGYVQRFRDLEFSASGGLLIEPWWVRRSGKGLDKNDYVDSSPKTVLYGAVVGVGLGYRIPLRVYPIESVTISAMADFATSFVFDQGLKVAGIGEQNPLLSVKPLARIGGLELNTGVALTVWFRSRSKSTLSEYQ